MIQEEKECQNQQHSGIVKKESIMSNISQKQRLIQNYTLLGLECLCIILSFTLAVFTRGLEESYLAFSRTGRSVPLRSEIQSMYQSQRLQGNSLPTLSSGQDHEQKPNGACRMDRTGKPKTNFQADTRAHENEPEKRHYLAGQCNKRCRHLRL